MALFGTLQTLKSQVCSSKFEKAFAYIEKLQDKNSNEYKTLLNKKIGECNKIVLDENCFVLEQTYITKDKEDCLYESHKTYIDIQYMFEGDEIMEVENVNNLTVTTEYNPDLDYAKYAQSKNSSVLKIKQNELAIFYPDDAHMPCIKIDENKKIIKAVFKILVNS
ncbi:MAG: YhcH/YjgK/YiaL family protein [Arcobacteraceae bacterium]|nr:YhcH/YjgK/YiaL family protein [Campylobacterales bacterium]